MAYHQRSIGDWKPHNQIYLIKGLDRLDKTNKLLQIFEPTNQRSLGNQKGEVFTFWPLQDGVVHDTTAAVAALHAMP